MMTEIIKARQVDPDNWMCYICMKEASLQSLLSLQTQENSGNSILFIDQNFSLNMSHTVNLTVEQNGDMHNLEVNEDVAKLLVSADTDAEVKQIIIDQLCRSQCDKTNQTNTEAVAKCSVDNPEVGDIMWTKPAEKLILDEHKKMEEEKKPSKNKWKRMSQIMCDNKYNFTAEQCRLKIKSLKDRYAKQKKNNTSGESPSETDPQLEDCFESQPDCKPVATIDTYKY